MTRPHCSPHDSREHSTTEADLLARVRRGDTEAFAILYDEHREAALRLAIAVAGHSRAEDLVAEVFTRTLQLLLSGTGPEHALRAYLFTAIRNLNVNAAVKERRSQPVECFATLDHATGAVAQPVPPGHDEIADALRTLPARWREVLWLTTIEGRSLDEVARLLDSNPNAVAQLAFRARQALRRAYLVRLAPAPGDEALPLAALASRGRAA